MSSSYSEEPAASSPEASSQDFITDDEGGDDMHAADYNHKPLGILDEIGGESNRQRDTEQMLEGIEDRLQQSGLTHDWAETRGGMKRCIKNIIADITRAKGSDEPPKITAQAVLVLHAAAEEHIVRKVAEKVRLQAAFKEGLLGLGDTNAGAGLQTHTTYYDPKAMSAAKAAKVVEELKAPAEFGIDLMLGTARATHVSGPGNTNGDAEMKPQHYWDAFGESDWDNLDEEMESIVYEEVRQASEWEARYGQGDAAKVFGGGGSSSSGNNGRGRLG
eukprot:g20612.t1